MDAQSLTRVLRAFQGSDAAVTIALFEDLRKCGPLGALAVNLFRAQKSSTRAKVYRGRNYRDLAYSKKEWAMNNLCASLQECGEPCGIAWGWGVDSKQPYHCHVLYIELPQGQISFHTDKRGAGPDHGQPWDGMLARSESRICAFIAAALSG